MRLLLIAGAAMLLASCSATKPLPQYTEAQKAAQRKSITYWLPAWPVDSLAPRQPVWTTADSIRWAKQKHRADSIAHAPPELFEAAPDSLPYVAPRRGLVGRVAQALGLARKPEPPRTIYAPAGTVLKLGKVKKGGQVTVQLGNGNTNSQASLGKSKAPTQQLTDSSSLVANTGKGQQQTQQHTTGSSQAATNTAPEAPGPLAVVAAKLTGPLGWVLGAAAAGALGYAVWYFWWLIPARRKKEQQPPGAVT